MRKRLLLAALCALAGLQAPAWGQYQNYAPPGAFYPPGANAPAMPGSYYQPSAPVATDQGSDLCQGTCSSYGWSGFADFLYLRPRNDGVAYGVIFNGPTDTRPDAATPIQVSPVASVDINYHPAWRTGIARSLDDRIAVEVTYTHYQGGGDDSLNTEPPLLIRSMVSQPSTWISNSLSDFLHAQATFHVLYDLGDMDYRWTFASSQQYS